MNQEYFIETEKLLFNDKNYTPNELSNTWFVQDHIDEEYQFYKLMAYLQRVDNNVDAGFLFQEYKTLKKRYQDLESFQKTYDIVNKDEESKKMVEYIYELPSKSQENCQLDLVVNRSIKLLRNKMWELKTAIVYLKEHIEVINYQIRDRRKKLHIYIEMCNCNMFEHYTLSKNGVLDYIGSFRNEKVFVDDKENNIIEVKTNVALNSKGVIIPYIIETTLSRN